MSRFERNFCLCIVATAVLFSILPSIVIAGGAGADTASAPAAASSTDRNPLTGNPDAIVAGARIFREYDCYTCHGSDLHGAVGPNLVDDVWLRKPTDQGLFATIARGRSGTLMAGFADQLSETQIWQVLSFIRSRYEGDPAKRIW